MPGCPLSLNGALLGKESAALGTEKVPPRALWPFCPTVHQHSEQQLNLSCLSCHLLNSAEVAAQNIYDYRSQQSIVCNLSPARTRSKPGQCSGISLASHPHSPTRGDWISNALCVVFKRHNTNNWHPRTRRLRGEGGEQSSSDQRCPSRLAEPRPSGRSLERPIFTDLSTRKWAFHHELSHGEEGSAELLLLKQRQM